MPPFLARDASIDPEVQISDGPGPGLLDTFSANMELGKDRSGWNRDKARKSAYRSIQDALDLPVWDGGESTRWMDQRSGFWLKPVTYEDYLWHKLEERRRKDPKFLPEIPLVKQAFEDGIMASLRVNRRENVNTAARAEGVANFVAGLAGGMAGAMSDPVNVALTPIGGTGSTLARRLVGSGLINMAGEAATIPTANRELAQFGEAESPEEQATNVVLAGLAGVALDGALEMAPKVLRGGKAVQEAAWAKIIPMLPERLRPTVRTVDDIPDDVLADVFEQSIGKDNLTPEQRDAITVLRRQGEIDAANPFIADPAGQKAHYDRLDEAMARILGSPKAAPRPFNGPADFRPMQGSTAISTGTVGDAATLKARIGRVENATGSNTARPIGRDGRLLSSALGRYQFTAGTWTRLYKNRFGAGGLSDDAIAAKRVDPALQEVLMDDLIAMNARALRSANISESAGNLYLAHFAGSEGAVRLHRADPNASARAVLGDAAVKANPFLARMSAADVIAWADRKMGGAGVAPVNGAATGDDAAAALSRLLADNEAKIAELDNQLADGGDGVDDLTMPVHDGEDIPVRVAPIERPPVDRLRDYIADKANPLKPEIIEKRTGIPASDAAKLLDELAKAGDAGIYRSSGGNIRRGTLLDRPTDFLTALSNAGGLLRPVKGGKYVDGWATVRDAEMASHDLMVGRGMDKWVAGQRLFRKGGMTLDEVGEWMVSEGFLTERPDTNVVRDWLERSINGGEKILRADDQARIDASAGSGLTGEELDAGWQEYQDLIDSNARDALDFGAREGLTFTDQDARDVGQMMIDRQLDLEEAVDRVIAMRLEEAIRQAAHESDDPIYDIFDQMELEGYGGSASSGRGAEGDPGPTTDAYDPEVGFNRLDEFGNPLGEESEALGPIAPETYADFDAPDGPGVAAQTQSVEHDLRNVADAVEVFHGTGHKFEAFSLDAIGSGEGTQAFGWGLYFAQNREVANFYRKLTSKRQAGDEPTFNGDTIYDLRRKIGDQNWSSEDRIMMEAMNELRIERNFVQAILSLENKPKRDHPLAAEAAEWLRENAANIDDMAVGHMYEVKIPADDGYILWDEPMSNQTENVLDLIKKNDIKYKEQDSGSEFYKKLSNDLNGPRFASKLLGEAGIYGIKYKDADSRFRDFNSHNYVVFNSDGISIVRRDGDNPDMFGGPTSADVRASLEKQGEGRMKGPVAQKPAGSDGGLFDNNAQTGQLDLGGGAPAAAGTPSDIEQLVALAKEMQLRLNEDGEPVDLATVLAELDLDDETMNTIRGCL